MKRLSACLAVCLIIVFFSVVGCSKKADALNDKTSVSEASAENLDEGVEAEKQAFVNSPEGLSLRAKPDDGAELVCMLSDKEQIVVLPKAPDKSDEAIEAKEAAAETAPDPQNSSEAENSAEAEHTAVAPSWVEIKTAAGQSGFVLSCYIEDSLEAIDFIRSVEGSYNESGEASAQKITIKYIGSGQFDVEADWKMFQIKKIVTTDEIKNTDFLCRSGSREGVQVDYKIAFKDSVLNYDFCGQYWDFDKDNNPINRRESSINTKLKRIESE